MALQADFVRDVAVRCTGMLSAAGYTYQAANDRETIRTYGSVKRRRITTRPRSVYKAAYTVPAHLTAGEQQLIEKVKSGADLWPHQSRKIGNAAFEDGMLNDYGLQHFHLGTTPDPTRPNLLQGTNELLFAVVKENDFHALGIFDHKAWSKQALLGIIQAHWPKLIDPYVLKGGEHMKVLGLRHDYTDEKAAKLRKAGVNVLTQGADGSVRAGPGGGITTNGKSISTTRDVIKIEDYVEDLQNEVIVEMMRQGPPPGACVKVEWRGDTPFAVTIPAALEINLSGRLTLPPL